jgi:hypothetical protein
MIEQEQQFYLNNPQQRSYEVNPTLGKVQALIRQQAQNNLSNHNINYADKLEH